MFCPSEWALASPADGFTSRARDQDWILSWNQTALQVTAPSFLPHYKWPEQVLRFSHGSVPKLIQIMAPAAWPSDTFCASLKPPGALPQCYLQEIFLSLCLVHLLLSFCKILMYWQNWIYCHPKHKYGSIQPWPPLNLGTALHKPSPTPYLNSSLRTN